MLNNNSYLVLGEFLENFCSKVSIFLFDLAVIFKTLRQIFATHGVFLRKKMEDIPTFEVKII